MIAITADFTLDAIEMSLLKLFQYIGIYGEMILQDRESQDTVTRCYEDRLALTVRRPVFSINPRCRYSKCIPSDLQGLVKYIDEFVNGTADDLGWDYTYHQLYAPYLPKVIEELKRCPYSRRACISLVHGTDTSLNPPCLQQMQFSTHVPLYGGKRKLDMAVMFRSNDALKAFPMNIQAIISLQEKVAKELGYDVGRLTYFVENFHVYEKDLPDLRKAVHIFDTQPVERRCWTDAEVEKCKEKLGISF